MVSSLVESNSLPSTTRMVGVSINTVTKLLVDAGGACAQYQHDTLRNLPCKRLQCDEIWTFCYCKQKNGGRRCPALHALQLCAEASDVAGHAGSGGGSRPAPMEHRGNRRSDRLIERPVTWCAR